MHDTRQRPRRHKIALACEQCRERKVRCDGAKPICATCSRRKLRPSQCVYNENTGSSENEKVLRERIRHLEAVCEKHGIDPNASSSFNTPGNTYVGDEAGSTDGQHSDNRSINLDGPLTVPPLGPYPTPRSLSDPAYGITAMGTIDSDDALSKLWDTNRNFYGGSSAALFLHDVCSTIGLRPAQRPPATNHGTGQSQAASVSKHNIAHVANFQLPPRALADHLVECYINRVYYLYPYFHLPAFRTAYNNLWEPADKWCKTPEIYNELGIGSGRSGGADTIVFHAALNAIFALGCPFSDLPDSNKITASEAFFNRSAAHMGTDLLEYNDLGVVQVLLLVSQALQGTSFPNKCWNAVGIACRMAFAIGLHVDPKYFPQESLEANIRRRTWHGCITIDILVSMTFGRPSIIPHSTTLRASETINVDQIVQDNPGELKLAFLAAGARLSKIIEQILIHIYPSPGMQPNQNHEAIGAASETENPINSILAVENALNAFSTTLPSHLAWHSPILHNSLSPEDAHILKLQRNVLHARFLYTRLLLYRPYFIRVISTLPNDQEESANTSTIEATLQLDCAKRCLTAAEELIDLIGSTFTSKETGSWWWNGLYICTSGLVLIVSRGYPNIKQGGENAFDRRWRKCCEILEALASMSKSASSSLELLSKIHTITEAKNDDTSLHVGQASFAESSGVAADLGIQEEPMSVQELLNLTGIFQDNSNMASGPFFYDWDYIDG